jgi:hypothetical protein
MAFSRPLILGVICFLQVQKVLRLPAMTAECNEDWIFMLTTGEFRKSVSAHPNGK